MKKKLEAELISIAHRILKLKNKSELVQLHQETQKLYEKLSVLRFVEENFADVKPTIGYAEIEEKIESAFDQNNAVSDEKPEVVSEVVAESVQAEENAVAETQEEVETAADSEVTSNDVEETSEENNAEPIIEAESPEETVSETEKEETAEVESAEESTSEANTATEPENIEPIAEAESPEEKVSEVEKQETVEAETETADQTEDSAAQPLAAAETEPAKSEDNSFKPSFELAFDPKEDPDTDKFNTPAQTSLEDFLHDNYVDPVFVTPEDLQKEKEEKAAQSYASYQSAESPAKSLNDRMAKGIIIGLNDRIAFMNHLFNNSSEDYNRVLSQLMTINTFEEAKEFIDSMVKPDYNNWIGKEEYEQRFMEIIEKKFS